MASEPEPDLFNTIRNRVSIILLKLDRHSKFCSVKPDESDANNFWVDIHKEFTVLSNLVKDRRSPKRSKHPASPTQRIFMWVFAFVIILQFVVLYEVVHVHSPKVQIPKIQK